MSYPSKIGRPLIVPAFLACLLLATLASIPSPAAAGPSNLTVYGWVYDSAGNPLEGADILVQVMAGSNPTEPGTTNSEGYYQVEFDLADWQIGDTVRTTATYNTIEDYEEAVATSSTMVNIDIHFAFEIPEFGSLPGVLVATLMVGAVAVFAVRKRQA